MEVLDNILNDRAKVADFIWLHRQFQGNFFRAKGDVAPRVTLDLKRDPRKGVRVLAIFSIDIKSFEDQWVVFLQASGFNHKLGDAPPLEVHSLNFPLRGVAPFLPRNASKQEVDTVLEWVDGLFGQALRFPSSIPALMESLARNDICGLEVWKCLGHPVKINAFIIWLFRCHEIDASRYIQRIEPSRKYPYDEICLENWC